MRIGFERRTGRGYRFIENIGNWLSPKMDAGRLSSFPDEIATREVVFASILMESCLGAGT